MIGIFESILTLIIELASHYCSDEMKRIPTFVNKRDFEMSVYGEPGDYYE